MWTDDININEVKEIRTRTTVYFGVGAIQKINAFLQQRTDDSVTMEGTINQLIEMMQNVDI